MNEIVGVMPVRNRIKKKDAVFQKKKLYDKNTQIKTK
jgi:hypothetical protein